MTGRAGWRDVGEIHLSEESQDLDTTDGSVSLQSLNLESQLQTAPPYSGGAMEENCTVHAVIIQTTKKRTVYSYHVLHFISCVSNRAQCH